MFCIDYFNQLLIKAYKDLQEDGYTYFFDIEEASEIFTYYFETYKNTFGESHKHIKLETLKKLILELPSCAHSANDVEFDLDVDTYIDIISQHFKTQYKNCDYSISHFMSGDIRANRVYEVCY